jgi:hypothetical protein
MRDVRRCTTLVGWFRKNLRFTEDKEANAVPKGRAPPQYQRNPANLLDDDVRAIILALSHCYYTRLGTTDLRSAYMGIIGCVLSSLLSTIFD